MLAPLWSELMAWLSVHAPAMREHVRPPGDPARLAAAGEQLGFALNAELVEWWQLHDGVVVGYLVPGYELFSVEHMLYCHEIERDVNLEEEVNAMARRNLGLADHEAGGPARLFPSRYVPVAGTGAGNYLVADCRPGPENGFLRDHDHEDRGVIQPAYYTSLTDLLARMMAALRAGQPMRVGIGARTHLARPVIEDGWLSWE